MPYRIISFDGALLPTGKPLDDLSTGQVESTVVDSLASAFDFYGSTRRLPRRQLIEYTGIYAGPAIYEVDDRGNRLVDGSGNSIIVTNTDYDSYLRIAVDHLKAHVGEKGILLRRREDDGAYQWKNARLLSVNHKRVNEDTDILIRVSCVFETIDPTWKSETATNTVQALAATATTNMTLTVSGEEEVTDSIITIAASSNVTQIEVKISTNQWLYFNGTILATKSLVIDCGAYTVKNDGVGAYANFFLLGTIQAWLCLSPGSNTISFVTVGGPATATITHYDQWS